jgi:hypothetical protein
MNHKRRFEFEDFFTDKDLVKILEEAKSFEEYSARIKEDVEAEEPLLYRVYSVYHSVLLKTEEMTPSAFDSILTSVIDYQREQKSLRRQRKIVRNLLKIASVFLLFATFSVITYRNIHDKNQFKKFADVPHENFDESIIRLSDGSTHILKNNDSYIEYQKDENRVIVEESPAQQEVIENKPTGKETQLNQVIVPYGKQQRLSLSDGTFVYLNSGSQLVYPADFSGKKREVYLIGEAFFEVTKNIDKPFIVKTEKVDIQVLGTKFNVSSYLDENMVSAVLVEGKVKVLQNDNLFIKKEYILNPDEGFFLTNENKEGKIKSVDVNNYVSWKSGVFQFKEMTFKQVIQKVNKYYNQSIKIENDSYQNTLISGKLYLNNDINLVIESLSRTIDASYTLNQDSIYVFK